MANRLQVAAQRLRDRLAEVASVTVTLSDGTTSVSLAATIGSELLRVTDPNGSTRVVRTERDYIFSAAAMTLTPTGPEPVSRGWTIAEVFEDGTTHRFMVVPPAPNEPCSRYLRDGSRSLVRAHVKTLGLNSHHVLDEFTGMAGVGIVQHAPNMVIAGGWALAGASTFELDGSGGLVVLTDNASLPAVAFIDATHTDFEARLKFRRGAGASTPYRCGLVFNYVDASNWMAYVIYDVTGNGPATNWLTCINGALSLVGGGSGADSNPSPGGTSYLYVRTIGELLLTVDASVPSSQTGEGNWLMGAALGNGKIGVLIDKAYAAGGALPILDEFYCRALAPEVALHEPAEQGQFKDVEPGDTATIRFVRCGPLSGPVTLTYATANGTATAGSDYTATSGSLTWADGEGGIKSFDVVTSGGATVGQFFNAAAVTINGVAISYAAQGFVGTTGTNVRFV